MAYIEDMIGRRQSMLVVIDRVLVRKVLCQCDCGNTKIMNVGHFNSGTMKSCGCHKKWHSKTGSKEFISYNNMMNRCHKPSNKRYADYGGKGIEVCKEWREDIRTFFKDMGDCPDGHQIDRIDNTKGYYKENCKWSSPKDNMNNRSISRLWIVNGISYSSSTDAAKANGVNYNSIIAWCKGRLAAGRYYPPKVGCSYKYIYPQMELL